MMGALDPLGMPLATDVLSGERADDGLYIPIIKRIEAGLSPGGLLFVGDCKMSALATRAYMAGRQHGYLAPLPLTGGTAEAMAQWIDEGIAQDRAGALTPIMRVNPCGQEVLVAEGYEVERTLCPGGQCNALERTGLGGAIARPCGPPGGGPGKTSGACGAKAGGPHASSRAGQTPAHRRSDPGGGDCPGAPGAAGGGLAHRGLGTAGRAADPLRRPGPRLCEACAAGA